MERERKKYVCQNSKESKKIGVLKNLDGMKEGYEDSNALSKGRYSLYS